MSASQCHHDWCTETHSAPEQPAAPKPSQALHYGLRKPGAVVEAPAPAPASPAKQWYQKPVTWIVGGVAALALVIGLAAGGSSADDKYIDRLDDGGIYYSSEANAIKGGHMVCGLLDDGYNVDQVTEALRRQGMDPYDAGFIVGASVYAYCDEYGNQNQIT